MARVLSVFILLLFSGCQKSDTTFKKPLSERPIVPVVDEQYGWLADMKGPHPKLTTLSSQLPPPKGYSRIKLPEGSFGHWLRGLPLRLDRREVHTYDGDEIYSPSAFVVYWDLGERNLLQCADTALRLHGEYLWTRDRAKGLAYHFTSGDSSSWKDWVRGERFVVSGSDVKRVFGESRQATHVEFRRYLQHTFRYAGTRSLAFDGEPPKESVFMPGDVFVQPGSPGHAVVVMDVAVNLFGRRVALIGQGSMPAQDLHILRSDASHVIDEVWFPLPIEGEPLKIPVWSPFKVDQGIRFKLLE